MKKYRPGRSQVPNPFKKTESRGKIIPSSHVGANNYRRRNNSALRGEKRYACTGNRSARREKKKRTVAAATIGNFFGHRSSPRLGVIGRADGVAAEIRRTDWPGTGVRKSLAAEFNACRAGWFIAMTLLSSPATVFPPIRWRVAKLRASLLVGDFRNGTIRCVAELQHMDTTWTEFAVGYRIQWDLSANITNILLFLKKKQRAIILLTIVKRTALTIQETRCLTDVRNMYSFSNRFQSFFEYFLYAWIFYCRMDLLLHKRKIPLQTFCISIFNESWRKKEDDLNLLYIRYSLCHFFN